MVEEDEVDNTVSEAVAVDDSGFAAGASVVDAAASVWGTVPVATVAGAASSASLLRTAGAMEDSRPRSRSAVRYSLKAVSDRRSGCDGFYASLSRGRGSENARTHEFECSLPSCNHSTQSRLHLSIDQCFEQCHLFLHITRMRICICLKFGNICNDRRRWYRARSAEERCQGEGSGV